jgi:DNA-binding XRE family transcriptional regulator
MLDSQPFTSSVAYATLPVAVDIDWDIGDVIRKLRKRTRMNQTVLAAKVGVNKATIVRAEAGDVKVSRETYLKIAQVLKTDIAALESEARRLQVEQDAIRQASVSGSHTPSAGAPGSADKRDGFPIADRPAVPHVTNPVPGPTRAQVRRAAVDLERLAREPEPSAGVAAPARAAGTPRQHAPAPRAASPPRRLASRKHRR